MASTLVYKVVQRRNMHKGAVAGSKLHHGQVLMQQTIDTNELCKLISDRSTASSGDVKLVIDGFIGVMEQQLIKGNKVIIGDLGSFRMTSRSTGTEKAEDFTPSKFRDGHILFSPGTMLKSLCKNLRYEREVVAVTKPEPDAPVVVD